MPTVVEVIMAAVAAQEAGRLDDAERLCNELLKVKPDSGHALHVLGMVAVRRGDRAKAIDLMRQSISLCPTESAFHSNLGEQLREQGELEKAVDSFQEALRLRPGLPIALNNLGLALQKQEKLTEAEAVLRQAIQNAPTLPQPHANLGLVLEKQKRYTEAIASIEEAIRLNPDYAKAHAYLASALIANGENARAIPYLERATKLSPNDAQVIHSLGQAMSKAKAYDEAITLFRRAISLDPKWEDAYNDLGNTLCSRHRFKEAIGEYLHAIELKPTEVTYYGNLCNAYAGERQFNLAIAAGRKALELRPDLIDARLNLGAAYIAMNHLDSAIAEYDAALRLQPDESEVRWNRALAYLIGGDFERGWAEYPSRWGCSEFVLPKFPGPMWAGEDLQGKSILLQHEQGMGDTIQFARYASILADRGAKVLLTSQTPLKKLMSTVPGAAIVLGEGERAAQCDFYLPLLNVPTVLKTTFETVPATVPYVHADAALVERWRTRLNEMSGNSSLKVGLVWAGNPDHANDRNRSMRLEQFAPLGDVPGVSFFGLQKGKTAEQAAPPGLKLIDLNNQLTSFDNTAAVLANLDLLISVDTSVAHLAGAMARPVWTLVPFAPDWRWMLEREDTPWYPTMKLIRQPAIADWTTVMNVVVERLHKLKKC